MTTAFGDARTLRASTELKKIMDGLVDKGLAGEMRFVWQLGAAYGIAMGKTETPKGEVKTFQNVNSLDPEEYFAAIMVGRMPDATPEERIKALCEHAEWGVRELKRKLENGTLDLAQLAAMGSEQPKKKA
jgi:hypothetical protein